MIVPGMCIKTELGCFYVSRENKRIKINSDRVMLSWSFPRVYKFSEDEVDIPIAPVELGFREGSFIHDVYDGANYIISNNKRRRMSSPESFKDLGLKPSKAIMVSHKEALAHEEGEDI